MNQQYSKNHCTLPFFHQTLVILFIFLCLFTLTRFQQAYAAFAGQACGNASHCEPPGFNTCPTATGGICGATFDCCLDSIWQKNGSKTSQKGGYVNEKCGNTATAKCVTSTAGFASCSTKNAGVCNNVSQPLYCCDGTKAPAVPPVKSTPPPGINTTTGNSSICARFPAPAGKIVLTCDGNNLQQCSGSTSKGTVSCSGTRCCVVTGNGVNDHCGPCVGGTTGGGASGVSTNPFYTCNTTANQYVKFSGVTITVGTCPAGQICKDPGSLPIHSVANICQPPILCGNLHSGGTCTAQQTCKGNGGIGYAGATDCTAGQTCCVFNPAAANILVFPQSSVKNPINSTLSAQVNAVSTQTGSGLLTQNKVLAANIYTAIDMLTYDQTVSAYTNSAFNLSTIPTGNYNLYLHIDKYLDTQITDTTGHAIFSFPTTQTLTTTLLRPIPGDVAPLSHGDNYIDIQDYTYVVGCLHMHITDPATATCPDPHRADLNSDGIVNMVDVQLVRDSFGQVGYSPFPPEFTCVTDPSCVSGNSTIQACTLKCSIIRPTQ